jgi:two-component system C4-dicarboxylate transport response regulator DctD
MRLGALDFIEKPFSSNRLTSAVNRAIEQRRLVLENRRLRQIIGADQDFGLVGQTPAMRELRRLIKALGPASVDVLILGETGTGKEVVARALHEASGRRGPFVAINCGALPESVFESEVFGHEAGSFTGAAKRRIGKFEHASGGTVFLDEIETMPLTLQAKLLRTLQERTVERLGSNEHVKFDCKVVAGTKVDLVQAYQQGTFRADLYYRLEVATVRLPPLRDRLADLPLLFTHFMAAAARRHEVEPRQATPSDMLRWQQHDWPGNVRELKNLAERWCLGLEQATPPEHTPSTALADVMARTERACIASALAAHGGNVALAAKQLDLPRKTLYDKLSRLSLDPASHRHT